MSGLVRGDALALPLADESVDLIVTSPPYFALRSYTDEGEHYAGQIGSEDTPAAFLEALWAATRECVRVLKPSGSMFVNLGDKYASGGRGSYDPDVRNPGRPCARARDGFPAKSLLGLPWRYALGCIDDLGLILRAEIVWAKPNGLPESVTDRVRRSHEQWFHFTRGPRYFSAVDEIREASTGRRQAGTPWLERTEGHVLGRETDPHGGLADYEPNPLGKLPGSVWEIPSEPLKVPERLGVDHFAAFPQEWPRRLILGWSPSGVCVECGEGRRAVVASQRTKDGEPIDGEAFAPPDEPYRTPNGDGGHWRFSTERTITGYACACDTPDAPSRPSVVLDPFAGTGTVPMVDRALGRTGIGVDLSADYLRLANWRVYESGHAAKTRERTNRERQGALL